MRPALLFVLLASAAAGTHANSSKSNDLVRMASGRSGIVQTTNSNPTYQTKKSAQWGGRRRRPRGEAHGGAKIWSKGNSKTYAPHQGKGAVASSAGADATHAAPTRHAKGAPVAQSMARHAVCLYGRAKRSSVASLLKNFVNPISADVFASVSLSEHMIAAKKVFFGSGDSREGLEMGGLRKYLNSSGRLMRFAATSDSANDMLEVHANVNKSSVWKKFGIWVSFAYLDWANRARCLGSIVDHEHERGAQYDFIGQSRMDIFVFEPFPLHLSQAASTGMSNASGASTASPVYIPVGDDFHPGIIDILSYGPRHAALLLGNAGRSATNNNACLLKQYSQWTEEGIAVYPESLVNAQLRCRGVTVFRFSWPHCRVDDQGFCRYPGEVSRLLNNTHSSSLRDHLVDANKERICGLLLPGTGLGNAVLNACRNKMAATTQAELDIAQLGNRTHESGQISGVKGSVSCLTNFGDLFCCKIQRRCTELSGTMIQNRMHQTDRAHQQYSIAPVNEQRNGTRLTIVRSSGIHRGEQFPLTFWINLDSSTARGSFMMEQFASRGIKAHRCAAVTHTDVATLIREHLSNESWTPTARGETPFARRPGAMKGSERVAYEANPFAVPCSDTCLKVTELACLISHVTTIQKAYSMVLQAKAPGALIVEDDATFTPNEWLVNNDAHVPGGGTDQRNTSRSLAQYLFPYIDGLGQRDIVQLQTSGPVERIRSLLSHRPGVRLRGYGWGTTAYYASSGCMETILQMFRIKSVAQSQRQVSLDVMRVVRNNPSWYSGRFEADYVLYALCDPFTSSRPIFLHGDRFTTTIHGTAQELHSKVYAMGKAEWAKALERQAPKEISTGFKFTD